MTKDFYYKIIDLIKSPIDEKLEITKGSTPIPFFGDIEKSSSCTISLNPSDREFYTSRNELLVNTASRLCYRKMLGKKDNDVLSDHDAEIVLEKCNAYFKNRPYKQWFGKIDYFLKCFDNDLSYYNGTVVGLDLVQWATSPKWDDISENSKSVLLNQGLPFLKELLLQKKFKYIFLNGRTACSKICEHLGIKYDERSINDGKNKFSVFFGKYNQSEVIGWSIYLQSPKGGGYDNIRKIASDVFNAYKIYKKLALQ